MNRVPKMAILDLNTRNILVQNVPETLSRKFLGGRGLDKYLFYNLITPQTSPFEPSIPIFLSIGLMTGTPIPGGDKVFVSGKTPPANFIQTIALNGPMAAEFKFSGFEHLVIHGRASHPVFIWINNGEIEILDASPLWGMEPTNTKMQIQEILGDEDIQVLSIDWNGENMFQSKNKITEIPFFENDTGSFGQNFLLGFKGIKAIALRGTQQIEIAQPEKAINRLISLEDKIRHCNHENKFSSIIEKIVIKKKLSIAEQDYYSTLLNLECFSAVLDALGAGYPVLFSCLEKFGWTEYVQLLEAITGKKYIESELKDIGERIVNMHRLLSIREGNSYTEDECLKSSLTDNKENKVFQLPSYYRCHGWDLQGRPSPDTLKRLQLENEPTKLVNLV